MDDCRHPPALPAAVRDVMTAVLSPDGDVSRDFFGHDRLGIVYRAYLILQFLDPPGCPHPGGSEVPGSRAAEVLSAYRLTGAGASRWIPVYEHTCAVVAAAETIARRMRLDTAELRDIRTGALLHDATKRQDVERHGLLAGSLENTDTTLAQAMRQAGCTEPAILAALNTGRAGRVFASDAARRESIEAGGVVSTIVGLADALSIGSRFVSLTEALGEYLERKRDPESQEFFTRHWAPYYQAAGEYLKERTPGLDLRISAEARYHETVFPAVFGICPPETVRRRYLFRP